MSSARILAPTPVIAFGCSALGGRLSARGSRAALDAAREAGITYFDTAPPYGFGNSEAILGRFFADRGSSLRQQIVLATKFGIEPPRVPGLPRVVIAGVRVTEKKLGWATRLSDALGVGTPQSRFSAELAARSLERSLKRLGTDYVDLLLLHEATASALQDERLQKVLSEFVASGKVRMLGATASFEEAKQISKLHAGLINFLQIDWRLLDRQLLSRELPVSGIGLYSIFGGGTLVNHLVAQLQRDRSRAERISELAETPIGSAASIVQLLLLMAKESISCGAVICRMSDPARIAENVRVFGADRERSLPVELYEHLRELAESPC